MGGARRFTTRSCAAALALMAGACAVPPSGVLGAAPHYGPGAPGRLPNAGGVVQRIWVPGFDDFFDPQGLAVTGDAILVSGFVRDTYLLRDNKGQCQLFRLDAASGRILGQRDVDTVATCGHAGGLAYPGGPTLFVADTATLFMTPLATAFDAAPPPFKRLALAAPITGGNAASGSGCIWLGTYDVTGLGRLYRFETATLEHHDPEKPLTMDEATRSIRLPSYTQGAAIDRDGGLWIARSNVDWGNPERIDPITGSVLARYDVPAGTEGLAFDKDGRLWAVSEAGARRFYAIWAVRAMYPFNPLIYAIDVEKLQP